MEYNEDMPYYQCSNLIPKFSASDILNLYQNQIKDLFAKSDSWTLFKPRYSNKDRSSLFFDHFENVRLSTALTELVIPAVDESNLTHTHLFTCRNDSKDDTFYDTLMATTAAPTFFPPYEIKGRGFFLDGALHLNNPAMAAYEKAIQYDAAKEKIFVLSLGTGSYLPDPLNPDLYRGNLFWAQNLHKVVLPQQEGNTDRSMYNLLGKCYQRWQVWFEEPISLDDCERVPHLLELGNQYIEELDASDENPINKKDKRNSTALRKIHNAKKIISQIEIFFLEIENLVKYQDNKTLNQSNIEQKFNEVRELIDCLEDDNEYGIFSHKYHTTYANYLRINGKIDRAGKQENLAKKFKKFIEKPEKLADTYKTNSRLFTETILGEEENIQEAVEKEIKIIQNTLEEKFIETIRHTFKQFNEMPKTFEDYKDIVSNETFLHKMVNNPINESLIDLDESQTSDTNKRSEDQTSRIKENKKLISSLNILKSLAVKAAYSKRLTFIYHALNSPNKKEILFSNTQFTEEEINKRFRELALYFHSDKTNRPNTPIWLQETHKNLGTELFFVIIEFKENLLNDLKEILQNEGYLTFHEKNANKLWKIAIDYRNAVREQWSKLRLLRKEDIEEIPSEKLKSLSKDNGVLAYQEYRAACKIADSTKNLKKQVELRGNMALCLYISNKFIEAQLYALAAIQLQLKNSQKVKDGDPMADTRENDDSVDVEETPELDIEINIEDRSEHTIALVKTVDQEFSFFDKKTIQNSINNDMAKVSIKLILKADQSLVRYQIPQEEILHAKNRALKYKASGVAAMGGVMTVGTSVTVAACFNIYEAVAIIGVTSIGGPFALIGRLLALSLGIWAGVNLWKRGNKLLEEPKIREKLNEIMVNALEAYDKGEYQKFIDAFSEEFKKDECLLKLEKREDTFDTKYIIDTLLNYGFRSDGIAYLLNLLGEVLCSGKIKIKGKVPKDLKELAMKAFDGVLNEKLENEARRLDDRIHELREKNHIASMLSKFRDFVSLEEYKSIAQEHKDDSQEMPFQSRLEEMRNITKINQAIFDILDAGKEEIERAIKTIKEVRDSINCNYQFISAAKWRCEVLEDLLWVIGGEESPKESPEESSKLSLITYLEHECISHLSKKLQYCSSNQEKLHIYNIMAILYEQLAEKEDKSNRLNSLYHWKDAQRNYEMAHEADPENLDANLGIAKCLLKFSKYTKVIQLINTSPSLTTSSEYWYFRSIAYCKKVDYKNAKENIIKALRLDNKN
ncbi:hypothetical protein RhiirA5_469043, partial [Rhizophagus irregularis]